MTSNTEKSLQILKEEIQRLEEQGISGHILEELMEFRRENDTGDAAEERSHPSADPVFRKRGSGNGDRGSVSGRKRAALRRKGHREKYSCRKSCLAF